MSQLNLMEFEKEVLAMTEEITLETKQLAEISLYMFEQYRKEFYTPGKHHMAIPQFHHWLQQLIGTEEAEL